MPPPTRERRGLDHPGASDTTPLDQEENGTLDGSPSLGQRAMALHEEIGGLCEWSSATLAPIISLGQERRWLREAGDPSHAARRALLAVEAVEARAAELDAILARLRAAAEAVDA